MAVEHAKLSAPDGDTSRIQHFVPGGHGHGVFHQPALPRDVRVDHWCADAESALGHPAQYSDHRALRVEQPPGLHLQLKPGFFCATGFRSSSYLKKIR